VSERKKEGKKSRGERYGTKGPKNRETKNGKLTKGGGLDLISRGDDYILWGGPAKVVVGNYESQKGKAGEKVCNKQR